MSSPERKRASNPYAVKVTPEKSVKKQRKIEDSDEEEFGVTAESVMGFPKYPTLSNGEIMKNHYGFVQWAKKKDAAGDANGALAVFIEWVESPEGQRLELEREGNEQFNLGKHKGKTFLEISQQDPGYHDRYMMMLRKKGVEPPGMLSRYITWLNMKRSIFMKGGVSGQAKSSPLASRSSTRGRPSQHDGNNKFNFGKHRGKTFREVAREDPSYHRRCAAMGYCPDGDVMETYCQYFNMHGNHFAAARGEMDAIEAAIGIIPPECYGQYDSE
eukprot:CAMPEP_0181092702 /NCGR_PEP_ID=MMETSP1071-20121207/9055_1 /TAXON_ID=35127 /ORGANISM="Thalassiosira sp., Strain NH16" /LENGTH=271 /DNA_ID=CAMNT_0023174891 /DNA_START=77 /DNA_END=892 /DNA_ORIENTATION=-